MAVAGYKKSDIDVQVQDGVLSIEGKTSDDKEDLDVRVENGLLTIKGKDMSPMKESEMSDFIHRGIAKRRFVKSWQLGEYVKLKRAIYKNGVLTVILKNEIPEEKKPTFIKIEDK